VTWDNRDVLPPHGAAARAVPGGAAVPMLHRDGRPDSGYPPTRGVPSPGVGAAATVFPRYQSALLTLAANATFQQVVLFAGRPHNITLQASATGLNFRLRNRGEEGLDSIRVLSTNPLVLYISKEIVEVQDPAGAGGQIVSAQGMWTDADI
jgi:hypothetical protein